MKNVFILAIAGAMFAGAASAADLPLKAPAAAQVASWAGAYVGLNAGYAWTDSNWQMSTPLAVITFRSGTLHPQGFIGGGQVGYNWQSGSVVWGIEADIDGRSGSGFVSVLASDGISRRNLNIEPSWLATVRPRLGVTFNNLLLYGTAGFAVGEIKASHTLVDAAGTTPYSTDSVRTGWAAGAGIEYALARPWSVKLEYLYTDLGTTTVISNADRILAPGTTRFPSKTQAVRIGVNYSFR